MKRILFALLLACSPAAAQQPVKQSGTTPGHAVRWIAPGTIADGGTAAVGFLTSVGVVASGPAICQNSGPVTAAYNQICLGVTSTGGTVTLNNFNGATGGLSFVVNGVTQLLPTLSPPAVAGDAVCFLNTSGQLRDCGGLPSLLPVPSNLTVAHVATSADCGKYYSLGGGTFYTFTFNAVGGYPTGCQILLSNADTARGKGIVINGLSTVRLLPTSTLTVINNGSAWVTLLPPKPTTAGITFYVNHTLGNDNAANSDCLATGAGACKTFQAAVDIIQKFTLPEVGGTNIQADCDANYDETVAIYRDIGSIINLIGNSGTPTNCTFISSTSQNIIDVQDMAQATITGFELGFSGAASGAGISARQIVIVDANQIYFGSNVGGTHVNATGQASIGLFQPIVNGNAVIFVGASVSSLVTVNSITIPAAGNPNINFWFDVTTSSTVNGAPAWNVLGTVAGAQFACADNGVISLTTAYPGALTAGASSGGCQHTP